MYSDELEATNTNDQILPGCEVKFFWKVDKKIYIGRVFEMIPMIPIQSDMQSDQNMLLMKVSRTFQYSQKVYQ